jgi:hypothetical protein
MKNIFSLLVMLFYVHSLFSQINKTVYKTQLRDVAKKDTGYARFQSELQYWIQKAKGRTTYAKEVKALFERNKPLLARVYGQYGDPAMNAKTKAMYKRSQPLQLKPWIMQRISQLYALPVAKNAGPPMHDDWSCGDEFNASPLNISSLDENTGEIIYTIYNTTYHAPSLVQQHKGFYTKITVPDDPTIIAARIRFEYSFFYTGWDTHGANNSIQLVFGGLRSNDFHSEAMMASTDTLFTDIPCQPRICIMEELMPADSIEGEFGEVHVNKQGSHTIDGYTKPKAQLQFYIGFGYSKGSNYGMNGHYLYGEFRVKKVTVTYYKSMPQ